MYQRRKIGLFRPIVEFAVRVEGEYALRAEDKYGTRSKRHLAFGAHDIFCDTGLDFHYSTFALLWQFCTRWSQIGYFKPVFRLKKRKNHACVTKNIRVRVDVYLFVCMCVRVCPYTLISHDLLDRF